MFGPDSFDKIDDDVSDDITESNAEQRDEDAAVILTRTALTMALTAKVRSQLRRHPSVIVMQVPDVSWLEPMAKAVKRMDNAPLLRIASEPIRPGALGTGESDLLWLQSGRSVMFISQNPGTTLHEAVQCSMDVIITVPPLSAKVLRRVIRELTGNKVSGVTEAMAKLDFSTILAMLRPGTSAKECVIRLQRAVDYFLARSAAKVSIVPLLSDLPLTASLRDWTDQTLADLEAVKLGEVPSSKLVFAVLEGPPGTGKTLIAESLARTADWNFVSSSVGGWFTTGDGALGGVARNVKKFVDTVLSSEPAIGFLDELDAVPDRASMDKRGLDWWTPVVTLLLTEIDRVRRSGKKVMLIGASNYYERLDSALIRPGRLEKRVSILPPQTEEEVVALFRFHLGQDLPNAHLVQLGRVGIGATPAAVEGWVREAKGLARAAARDLTIDDILLKMLPEDLRTAADKRAIAIHEIGHAVVASRLGHQVQHVSIIASGQSGGYMQSRRVTAVPTWRQVQDLVAIAMAGRAADISIGAGANTSAEADLAVASSLLLAAHKKHGLREGMSSGDLVTDTERSRLHRAIEIELGRQLERAIEILVADTPTVMDLAAQLMEEQVLVGATVDAALRSADRASDMLSNNGFSDKVPALHRQTTNKVATSLPRIARKDALTAIQIADGEAP